MAKTEITKQAVLAALSDVKDPLIGRSLISEMLLRDIQVAGKKITLTAGLITLEHPHKAEIEADIKSALKGMGDVKIKFEIDVPSDGHQRGSGSDPIRTAIAIASGKGGVGKSTVAVNIAVSMAMAGAKVGLLDADVYGPNVPIMMGVADDHIRPNESGKLEPVEAHGVKMMSIGFLVAREQPIVWRGPMLHSAIGQFVNDVNWGEIDYLLIDLPPGTGDAQLSMAQILSVTGGVIVTLPQQVSLDDARRGLEMFHQLKIPVMGVVENMSYLETPQGEKMDIFGSGGGQKLAKETDVPFLGEIPMDPAVRVGGDAGIPIVVSAPDSAAAKALQRIAIDIAKTTSLQAFEQQKRAIPITMVN
ncbi:MAG: Mrp/NBP35 family ATP-binding protein [Chloroflexota bacterium]